MSENATIYDPRFCELGEGPLWHPERNTLFWFDIITKRLMSREGGVEQVWEFDEHVSAAGWVDTSTLLMASETGLYRFDLTDGARSLVAPLEADNPVTRSNDGRADPYGGFWIGTMGKRAEPGAGVIYRFYRGEVRRLYGDITIANSICFAPGGQTAYFTDTVTQKIMQVALDKDGWPKGAPFVFVDLTDAGLYPDGSVVDAEGTLWNAQWGASRVTRYRSDGSYDGCVEVGGRHTTCPAFGGSDLRTVFVTTARQDMEDATDKDGVTYQFQASVAGQREAQVKLD